TPDHQLVFITIYQSQTFEEMFISVFEEVACSMVESEENSSRSQRPHPVAYTTRLTVQPALFLSFSCGFALRRPYTQFSLEIDGKWSLYRPIVRSTVSYRRFANGCRSGFYADCIPHAAAGRQLVCRPRVADRRRGLLQVAQSRSQRGQD